MSAERHRTGGAPATFRFGPYPSRDGRFVPGPRPAASTRGPDVPAAHAAHDAALARLGEGHCPECSGRLTVHRGSTFGLDIGRTDTGGSVLLRSEIPTHGYCPTCRLCVEDVSEEWGEPVYATWEGCPLVDLPADTIRVSSDRDRRDVAL